MEWISRVMRGAGGRLQIKVVNSSGEFTLKDLANLKATNGDPLDKWRRTTLSLASLVKRRADAHLEALGFHVAGSAGQPVYEIDVQGQTWSIPSQLLVTTMFCTREHLRERLLTPFPLRELVAQLTTAQTYTPSLKGRLNWLIESPSAFRAWGSVYRYALEGRFDMTLPDATIEVLVRGREVNGVFYATHMRLLSLRADDLPHHTPAADTLVSAAGASPEKPADHKRPMPAVGVAFRMNRRIHHEPRLSGWTASSRLTDAQWAAIHSLIAPDEGKPRRGAKRVHDLRVLTETIFVKLASGVRWPEVPGDRNAIAAARSLFVRLRSHGLLDRIVAIGIDRPPPLQT